MIVTPADDKSLDKVLKLIKKEPEEPAEEGTPAIESPWFWVGVGLVVVGVAVAVAFSASGTRYVLDAPVIR